MTRITPVFLFMFLSIAGCSTTPQAIDTYVSHAPGERAAYSTFAVVATDIPAFLGPIIVSNFSVALSHHGLQPVTEGGELLVTLRYVQEDLNAPRQHDDFEERLGATEGTRFIARIAIEIHDARSGERVWSGQVQRLHDVSPGEWMHTGRASIAIYDAFREVLADF